MVCKQAQVCFKILLKSWNVLLEIASNYGACASNYQVNNNDIAAVINTEIITKSSPVVTEGKKVC